MRLALALPLALCLAAPALAQRGPVETGRPNAPNQSPAFENQTRAPQPDTLVSVATETIATSLPRLWAMEFLPDERMLVTAKAGTLHIVADGLAGPAIAGVPEVMSRDQGGLLDVALAPDYADSGMIYLSYAEPRGDEGNGTSVLRARLVTEANGGRLENVEVIFRQMPSYRGGKHFGSRLVFHPDGTLFITTGERSDRGIRERAQDLDAGMGKVFRINPDGSVPEDNPFVGEAGVLPEIWSYGHRNVQSAVMTEDGTLWTVAHGPRGGDELNQPEAGKNYGWPVITYGIEYSGRPVGQGITAKEGMEQPVYYWDPVIAPSGMAIYRGEEFPELEGQFLIGGLRSQSVVILDVEDGRVATEQRVPLGARVRDVKVGPDGAIYAVTEARGGSDIVRLSAEPAA